MFPDPVISIAVAPKDKAASEKMGIALGKMIQEDPSFRVETDEDSGETILKGMGELHLDIKVDILKRTHGVEVDVGKPQVAYRETITQRIEDSYTHKKQTGGSGQFAKIDYIIEPGEPGSGFEFESKVTGGNVPRNSGRPSRRASRAAWKKACWPASPARLQGHPDRRRLSTPVDSSAIAFELAARAPIARPCRRPARS